MVFSLRWPVSYSNHFQLRSVGTIAISFSFFNWPGPWEINKFHKIQADKAQILRDLNNLSRFCPCLMFEMEDRVCILCAFKYLLTLKLVVVFNHL